MDGDVDADMATFAAVDVNVGADVAANVAHFY
jgi:hypothetical protein